MQDRERCCNGAEILTEQAEVDETQGAPVPRGAPSNMTLTRTSIGEGQGRRLFTRTSTSERARRTTRSKEMVLRERGGSLVPSFRGVGDEFIMLEQASSGIQRFFNCPSKHISSGNVFQLHFQCNNLVHISPFTPSVSCTTVCSLPSLICSLHVPSLDLSS